MEEKRPDWRIPVVLLFTLTIVLSSIFSLGFLWAFIIAFAWPTIGTLVTFDDDLPGGWSNPDGSQKPPYVWLFALMGIEALMLTAAMMWPNLAAYGVRDFVGHLQIG